LTNSESSRYSGPIRAVVLIHDGFFSTGCSHCELPGAGVCGLPERWSPSHPTRV
jgi:hypothetical protein